MKVLWFTNTPSLYENKKNSYNGGGWIESLEGIIGIKPEIDLAVSFFHSDKCFKNKIGQTTYYPISLYSSKLDKVKRLVSLHNDKKELSYYLRVVNDFKPDIIHIFGSEQSFGLLSRHTKIPLIIQTQGLLNPILNAYYPPGFNSFDIVRYDILNPLKLILNLYGFKKFKYNGSREAIILSNCNFFIGRTEWDKKISKLYSPNSKYYYCSEVLREPFFKAKPWQINERTKLKIISTISKNPYKGFDLILKTAKLLNKFSEIDFEWNIFGINGYEEWEKKLGIKSSDVNVFFKGVANSETLVKYIQDGDVFVHPSYIDNSPNSICEAQMIGIPVISTNVGGISTLIEDNKTGFLVPANDPFTLFNRIIETKRNKKDTIRIAKNGRNVAIVRHDKEKIKTDLLTAYNYIKNA